jgi:poly-gamma-glutamate synthesis protein (capsule biosynthesis protein)
MLDRGVGKAIRAHGPDYPFGAVRRVIRSAGLSVFNCECVLSTRGARTQGPYRFRADPSLAGAIARAGFKVAVLANNHAQDYGPDALADTMRALQAAGITAVGAGQDQADAALLKVVEKGGLRVGFLAFCDVQDPWTASPDDAPTVARVEDEKLGAEVAAAKPLCDTLVVVFHCGVEYMKRPTERQVALAHKCVDAGADLVLGCHPHVLQTVEEYKGKPIVYSMGGFVFDSNVFDSDRSAMFLFELRKRSARLVRTIPILMKGGRTQPAASN